MRKSNSLIQSPFLYRLEEGNILKVTITEEYLEYFTLESAKKHEEACYSFFEDKKMFLFLDGMDTLAIVELSALKYMASSQIFQKIFHAEALVFNRMGSRNLAQFYSMLVNHLRPVRLFHRPEPAEEWLRDLQLKIEGRSFQSGKSEKNGKG